MNIMPYLLVLKKRQNLKLSFAANYRWRFKGFFFFLRVVYVLTSTQTRDRIRCIHFGDNFYLFNLSNSLIDL